MKLAEALARRADIQRRIEGMRGRLTAGALVQEGEAPPEHPDALLVEVAELLGELEALISRINRTNLSATIADGTVLTEALARRDVLALRHGLLGTLVRAASERVSRYGRNEIRILATIEVGPLRRRMDEVAKERRELDTAIQEANWTTELSE